MQKNYTTKNTVLEENLIFKNSRTGARGYNLEALDVPLFDYKKNLTTNALRNNKAQLPEVSEPEVMRHFTRLSTWNYSIDLGIYPLGSCTMKHNPRLNEEVARSQEICELHPYDPEEWAQGHLQIMYELQNDLQEITGMAGVSLQPSAGAQGEFTGLLLISAYHKNQGNHKKTILTADTSHGTNPASAALAGYKIIQVNTGADGAVSTEAIQAVLNDDVAALMITNPNTLGFFEKNIHEIARLLHEKDALLYIDGANMNAVLGISRPGDYGADVIQFNLHKTFTTPHGGGGPGSGPIAVSQKLVPFMPTPRVEKNNNLYTLNYDVPKAIGRVKAFYGNFGMFVRAWCYIRALGAKGLREVSENAILNANYIKSQLKHVFHIPVDGHHLHEVVFNDKNSKDNGFDTTKIAKALIEFGIHPPTVHFPLCVKNAIMIEPTETETKEEMDRFIDAMKQIVQQDPTIVYPKGVIREKIDEVKAARELNLNYFKQKNKTGIKNKMKQNYSFGVIFCFLATLSWGVMFPIMTSVLTKIDPFTFTAIRYSFVGIIFLILLIIKEGKKSLNKKDNFLLLWLFGSAGFAGFGFLVLLGQQMVGETGALSASIMMATIPLLGLLVNWALKKGRPHFISILFILLSFFGVVLVLSKGNISNFINHPQNLLANLSLIAGALCWVFYTIGATYFPSFSPLKYTCLTTLYGMISVYFINFILITTGLIALPNYEQILSIFPELMYSTFIAGIMGVLFWNMGNKILTPINGVLFMNVVPIAAFLMSIAYGVMPVKSQILGAVITSCALILNNLFQRRNLKIGKSF